MSPTRTELPPAEAEVRQAPAFTAAPAPDTTLTDSWVTLRKWKYLIIGLTLLGFIYGWYQASTQPRLYDASGTIEIRNGSSNQYKINATASSSESGGGLASQVVILKSNSLMLRVARDLNLANDPAFMGPSTVFRNLEDPVIRQIVTDRLQGTVFASAIPKTDLVVIHAVTGNPQLSANIVNTVVNDYIQSSFQSKADATERVSNFFSQQLGTLKQEVESSQQKMIDLQKKLGVLGFDPSLNQVTANLSDLEKATITSSIARMGAETRYRELSTMDRKVLDETPEGVKSAVIAPLRAQLENAETQLDQVDVVLGPNNPKVKVLNRQIADIKKTLAVEEDRIISEAKQSYLAAKAQEDQAKASLDSAQNEAYGLRDDLLEYQQRLRDFQSNQTLYDGLHQRLRTAGVEAGLESTEIDIVDKALPPLTPTLKPRTSMLVVNSVVMLIVGVVISFLLDSLDTGLRTVAEIEGVSGLPSLALIPRGRRITSDGTTGSVVMKNVGLLASPKSQFAEAFRALRTSLLLSVAGGEPKTILLSSATPSEGKTTVSINLACVLAQRNVRVLLIDADLRRPTVHHRFGLNGKVGLTSVLTGSMSLEDAIQRVPEMPLLDILVSGPVPPFPTEMLGSQTMHDLLERCRGIYTHIVMDSPPLLSVTDSVVLAREADAVVMIVRHGKSSKHALRRGRDLLVRSGSRLTGIVLNAVDLSSPEYYAYYGYYGYTAYAAAGVDSGGWEAKNGTVDGDDTPPTDSEKRNGGTL
jgi:capsular exopolysaccharide synthesis family protein